ncbi:MAG TPA: hypothetical protein VFQ63_01540 [Patescibacteria group bacterium]|nr:hypothetical protein [Patescibacteria group bacterium]
MSTEIRPQPDSSGTEAPAPYIAEHVGGGDFALISQERVDEMIQQEHAPLTEDDYREADRKADLHQRNPLANGLFGGLLGLAGGLPFGPIGWVVGPAAGFTAFYGGSKVIHAREDAKYTKAQEKDSLVQAFLKGEK